jgi:hypothetical protein
LGGVILERQRISDAAALEGQALLVLEIGVLFRLADAQGMLGALQEARREQACDIAFANRAVGDAALRRRHFHHRLQPQHAARAIADDLDRGLRLVGFRLDRQRHFIGAERDRRRVAWDVDRDHHRPSSASTIWSKRFGVTRP